VLTSAASTAHAQIDPKSLFHEFSPALNDDATALVAISGGSDSTALLFLLKDYLEAVNSRAKLVAITIDHALREGSAAEAQAVSQLCESQGITHRTMVWRGTKPATGISAAARATRYGLLAEAASSFGATSIFTGHTADDQAETVMMRQARQAGRGLSGMASATLLENRHWLLRPLLATRRETLRDYLRNRNIAWFEDPTNQNDDYERPRMRQILRTSESDLQQKLHLASSAAHGRHHLGQIAASLIDHHIAKIAPGLFRIDSRLLEETASGAALYAVRLLLAVVGGKTYLPDEAKSRAVLAELGRPGFCATLSRCVVEIRATGIYVFRENRALPAARALKDGELWDERFRLHTHDDTGLSVAPVGETAARKLSEKFAATPGSTGWRALSAEPALWREGQFHSLLQLVNAPENLDQKAFATPILGPWAQFLPGFDFEPASALGKILHADAFLTPPLLGHKESKA
jgi:tRNA(Ile)-lysidine synthase